jgi:DNA repair exonuclease SbcCD ATPase subunit
MKWSSLGAVMLVAGVLGTAAVGRGQAQRDPATMDDLVTEMRGLRADLAQTAAASARMQLLVARLTIQEQRVNAVIRDYTAASAQLERAIADRSELQARTRTLDATLNNTALPDPSRRGFDMELLATRAELEKAQASEQRLRTQLNEASALVSSEQSRWSEFNTRLDELERSLPALDPR